MVKNPWWKTVRKIVSTVYKYEKVGRQAVRDRWGGERGCETAGCSNHCTGAPVKINNGGGHTTYARWCSKCKTAQLNNGFGEKRVNVIAAAQTAEVRRMKAEQRRQEKAETAKPTGRHRASRTKSGANSV